MSWDNEFTDIEKEDVGGLYISAPGAFKVSVLEAKLSPETHTGAPYLEVKFKRESDGAINTSKLYRVKEGDKPDSAKYKREALKKLFSNAGIDMKASGMAALKEIVGKELMVLFRAEEYIGKEKDNNNKPVIKEAIKYLYSGPANQELDGKQSYFHKALDEKEMKKFEALLKKWERDNPEGAETKAEPTPAAKKATKEEASTEDENNNVDDPDDDLPF